MNMQIDETPLHRVVHRGFTYFIPAGRLPSPEIMLMYNSILTIDPNGKIVKSRYFSPVGNS